jgi:hypothetical protein
MQNTGSFSSQRSVYLPDIIIKGYIVVIDIVVTRVLYTSRVKFISSRVDLADIIRACADARTYIRNTREMVSEVNLFV